MKAKTIFKFSSLTLALVMGTSIFGYSSPPAPQGTGADLVSQLPPGEGKGYVQTICTSCHGLGQIVAQQKTKVGWEATVYDMLGRISAGMDREAEIISSYLSAHFGVEPAPTVTDSSKNEPGSAASEVTIYHQVVFRFKPEVSVNQIQHVLDTGRAMLESISEVATVIVGTVAQQDSDFTHGLVTGFKNNDDLQSYRSHPDHRAWLTDIYRPLIEESLVTDIVAP
ncbi:MAG: Dabb family protein [Acidobacteriota bacterium]